MSKPNIDRVLVTGARGFIGSALIRSLVKSEEDLTIIAFARGSQSWTRQRLEGDKDCAAACRTGRLKIAYGDLCGDVSGLCEGVDAVLHLAARTFVDHSIRDPAPFINSNVLGTANMLEEARRQGVKAFFQVSTDEVYGQILEGAHDERSPISPRNPYAASKAGGDALAISYAHSFGMFTCVTRTENNYGPYQHPQKAIPTFIGRAAQGKSLPVYGDGGHVRQWLHVQDHVDALLALMKGYGDGKIEPGEVFHIAGGQELTNMDLARLILDIAGQPHSLIELVDDYNIRPGHDRRYALSTDKIRQAVGWEPKIGLQKGLQEAVKWYLENPGWLA